MGRLQGLSPIVRTPGRYHRYDLSTGKEVKQRLKGTNESVHRSVRVRVQEGGLGVEDEESKTGVAGILGGVKKLVGLPGKYQSEALKGFDLVLPSTLQGQKDYDKEGKSGVVWKARDGLDDLPEADLGRTEIRLLKRSVETANGKL
jgi:hypothetical protein